VVCGDDTIAIRFSHTQYKDKKRTVRWGGGSDCRDAPEDNDTAVSEISHHYEIVLDNYVSANSAGELATVVYSLSIYQGHKEKDWDDK
jgi:hypothetical protein